MRHTLLFMAAALATASAMADTFSYGLCGDVISPFGVHEAGCNYSAAIEVPEAVASDISGSTLKEISIGFGSGMAKIATLFLTYDLDGEPFYEEQVKGLKANQINSFSLATPYIIEGKGFYIGYRYRASTTSGAPIGFDDSFGAGNPAFSHLAVWMDGASREWHDASEYGNLSLTAEIEGARPSQPCVVLSSLSLPAGVSPNKEFNYTVGVSNLSSAEVKTLEICTEVGASSPSTTSIELEDPIAAGQFASLRLQALSQEDRMDLPVKVSILKVNGEDNSWSGYPMSGVTISSDNVFERVVVAEEYTGTECGWCPRGRVSLELLNEKYPDTFLGIEAHTYSRQDPMYCPSYMEWTNTYASGAPYMVMNRNDGFSPDPGTVESHYLAAAGLVRYKVEPVVEYAGDSHTQVNVTVRTIFGEAFPSNQFGLAFVVIQDGLGPYSQANNYSGSSTPMGGFEDLGSRTMLTYSGVAREIIDWKGRAGTIPSNVEQGETCEYSTTFSVPEPDGDSHARTKVAVLLIDRKTGEILTAGRAPISDPYIDMSGVEGLKNGDVKVMAQKGSLRIEGNVDYAEVYTTGGMRAARVSGASEISLPAGIYIVRVVEGGKATVHKCIVK